MLEYSRYNSSLDTAFGEHSISTHNSQIPTALHRWVRRLQALSKSCHFQFAHRQRYIHCTQTSTVRRHLQHNLKPIQAQSMKSEEAQTSKQVSLWYIVSNDCVEGEVLVAFIGHQLETRITRFMNTQLIQLPQFLSTWRTNTDQDLHHKSNATQRSLCGETLTDSLSLVQATEEVVDSAIDRGVVDSKESIRLASDKSE